MLRFSPPYPGRVLRAPKSTVELCRLYPDRLFLFAGSLRPPPAPHQEGMRHEPNTALVPTRWDDATPLQDDEPEIHLVAWAIGDTFLRAARHVDTGRDVVMPFAGFGGDELATRAPKVLKLIEAWSDALESGFITGRYEPDHVA